jgi:hypothetical protein
MDYRSIKWLIFTALSLTVPALLYLFMAVMVAPAIFFVAGIGYVIPKAFTPGHFRESFWFIVILGVHIFVYFGLYYVLSVILAKLITLIKRRLVRNCLVAIICSGLLFLTQFSVYGGGGHSSVHWYTLAQLFDELNQYYGTGAVQIVYGVAILLFFGILSFPKINKKIKNSF